MDIGCHIKRLREQSNLTQKDLADQLNVTSQAVSRWENNNVEPSVDTLKRMSKIFSCSVDNILSGEPNEPTIIETSHSEPLSIKEESNTEVIEEQVLTKPVVNTRIVCKKCEKTIEIDEKHHEETLGGHKIGRGKNRRETPIIHNTFCQTCWKKERLDRGRGRRLKSFIVGGLIAAIFLIFSITGADTATTTADATRDYWVGAIFLIVSSFTLASCLCLANNFVGDMWFEVASWGFVSMPGIIFSLDFDSILWAICIKILLGFIAALLVLLAIAFATILALFISIIVYPFALIINIKNPKYEY